MILKFLLSVLVAVVLRPVFRDDAQYFAISFLVGLVLTIVSYVVESRIDEKK